MGMVVRTNVMAMNANRQLGINNTAVGKSLEKLSSGFRINRAADDASGLAISEKMKAQIKGLETASANSQDGISLIQTAEGASTEIHDMLNRMVELATKSANGTIQNEVDREAIQREVDDLNSEITRISKSTNFNGINLLDGSMGLNKAAFAFGGQVSDAVKGELQNLTAAFGNVAGGTAHVGGATTTQSGPSFSIDLGNLGISKGTTAAGDTSTVSITLGGATFTTDALAGAKDWSTEEIRDALIGKINTQTTAAGANTAGTIGGLLFKAEADGTSGIKFTYTGVTAGATASSDEKFTAAQAATVNGALSGNVAIGGAVHANASRTGDVYHDTFNVKNAVEAKVGARAGMDFVMTADMIADGNKLTIDGKTFVFKKTANSGVTAGEGETLIDLSNVEVPNNTTPTAAQLDAEKLHKAIDMISNYETTNFKLEAGSMSAGGNDAITLHIDQKLGNSKVYADVASLQKQFQLSSRGVGAKTSFSVVNNSKITEGNSVNVNGKQYTFGSKAGQIAIGADAESTLRNLQAALEEDGYSAETTSDGKIIIEAKAGGSEAPVVQGNGLTLQIGDTADDFNKVTVAVDDLSSVGIGTDGLNVSNQDAASASIQTIKDAINQVSTNRANLGSLQNRLEHTINNLDTTAENMTSANSRIRDTDMAKEMMNYTKMNVLQQAAQAMLAQANQAPQAILQLLQ